MRRRTWQPSVGEQFNYFADDILDKINDVDVPAMAVPGRETMACEEGEGMGNDGTSFAVVVGGGGDGSIQAAQG